MSPSELLTAAADRVRDLAAAPWAAPRDASWFDRPNTHQPKRWHVATPSGLSLCYSRPLVEAQSVSLDQVPEELRCQHWGCRRYWPGAEEPPRPECSVAGCDREVEAKGVCKQHGLARRRGRPLVPIGGPLPSKPIQERFWAAVDKNGPWPERSDLEGRCWVWTRALDHGYGSIQEKGTRRNIRAHRLSYELHGGTLVDDLDIDHLCRNRACVNPAHLELVTNTVNVMRGEGLGAKNARKTHCKNGHPFAGDNLIISADGRRRQCRACRGTRAAARSELAGETP